MTKTRSKIVAAGAAATLATGALASCGGDSVSADEYVGSVCSAMGEYVSTISSGQAETLSALSGDADPAEGKEQITSFLGEAITASEDVASQIDDAGVPDVDNGEEIADAISEAFNGITETFETAQSEAEALPTDSPESFESAAQEITTNLQEGGEQIGEGLESVAESPELEEAAQNNEECEAVQSTPTPPAAGG